MASKLSFKEESSDDEEQGKNAPVFAPVIDVRQQIDTINHNLPAVNKQIQTTSDKLFDLENSDNKEQHHTKPTHHPLTTHAFEISHNATRIDIEVQPAAKPEDVAVKVEIEGEEPTDAPAIAATLKYHKPVSSWLGRFLETKRSVIDPNSLAPDLEPSSDAYLQEFAKSFQDNSNETKPSPTESISDDSSDDDDDNHPQSRTQVSSSESEGKNDKDLAFVDDDDVLDIMESTVTQKTKMLPLNIFNLPYTVQVAHVESFLRNNGIEVLRVELGGATEGSDTIPAGRKPLPLGAASATVIVPEGSSNDEIIQLIQGKSCGGRPVRVQKAYGSSDGRRRSSGGAGGSLGRYFEQDISTKCHICGVVGHRMQECTNEKAATPCHLCAGTDHEPSECPNLLCYRCGRFGHHSRDCRAYGGASRPIACYQCGSIDHIYSQCPQFIYGDPPHDRYSSAVDGASIVCMVCRRPGHSICGPRRSELDRNPQTSSQQSAKKQKGDGSDSMDIFCPNCGERGHHIDFLPASVRENSRHQYDRRGMDNPDFLCYAPKCEAFFRFQHLQKDYEDLAEDEKNDYYRSLSRGAYDMSLFPSLNNPPRRFKQDGKRTAEPPRVGHKRFREDSDEDGYNETGGNKRKASQKTAKIVDLTDEVDDDDEVFDDEDDGDDSEYWQDDDDDDGVSGADGSDYEDGEENDDNDYDDDYYDDDEDDDRGDGRRARKRQRRESYHSTSTAASKSPHRAWDKPRNSKRKQFQDYGETLSSQTQPHRNSYAHHHKTSKSRKEKRQAKHAKKQSQHEQQRQQQQQQQQQQSAGGVATQADRNWNRIRQQQQQQSQTSSGASAAQAWQDRLHQQQHRSNHKNHRGGQNQQQQHHQHRHRR